MGIFTRQSASNLPLGNTPPILRIWQQPLAHRADVASLKLIGGLLAPFTSMKILPRLDPESLCFHHAGKRGFAQGPAG